MKASLVQIHLQPSAANRAGHARLAKVDDDLVTTEAQADSYTGPTFVEGPGCGDLHVVYRDGFVCVNFVDDQGHRANYDFPTHTVARVKRLAAK
ncbi:hypothetical protein [Pseudomonas phage Alpheus]|uniref:Uncharacterized protein n=1 Tax=Pseudomonas phage Alpheus TaxID=2163983 RepID=A0A2S1GMY8_9CAUD|nr:hypothetical protein HOT11_gp16 [Pseudomonas phage Alpheus]AWD90740.1 hypothetical protein [Pseudomonas phage Alpheus]